MLRELVSDELAEVAATYGTPRRTVLLEGVAAPAAAVPLEVQDVPCRVLLSSTGLLARTSTAEPLAGDGAARCKHDVVVSAVHATARGTVGVVTTAGRVIKLDVVNLPALPPTAGAPSLRGGAQVSEFVELTAGEHVLALVTLGTEGPWIALGTERGVVKRVNRDYPAKGDAFDVVRLDDGDRVIGVTELVTGDEDLVFVTSDAQLLRTPAGTVRPQGRTGGGIAGIKLTPGAEVVFFAGVAADPEAVVVTVAGSTGALPGAMNGSAKVAPLAEYPYKGRATGGVRCHRLLKGEDTLLLAWAGRGPARAADDAGDPVDLPPANGRRDGSGTPTAAPVVAVGGTLG